MNKALWRALHGLSHNVSVAAVVLLIVNDHLLRVWFPSWLTGKLGDVAWLIFSPFICASVFAWVVRGRRQERVVGLLSFGFIGAWFVLAKTVPLVNQWTNDTLNWLLGYHGGVRIDPTDLLALSGLWAGWWVWTRADNQRHTLRPNVWAVMALGVMATVATSQGIIQTGLGRLCKEDSEVYAFEFPIDEAHGYRSADGGLTWTPFRGARDVLVRCDWGEKDRRPTPFQSDWKISDRRRTYRSAQGVIESSTDDGQTWTEEIDPSRFDTDARGALHVGRNQKPRTPGPLDAIVSEQGNLIVAMGSDGALVRSPDGKWQWVAVGNYHLEQFSVSEHLSLLDGWSALLTMTYIGLTALMIGAPFTTSALRRAFMAFVCIVLALAWLSPLFLSAVNILLWLLPLIEAAFMAKAGMEIYRVEPRALFAWLALSFAAGALFLLPYVLWAFETIPRFFLAHIYALAIGAGAIVSCRLYIRRLFPHVFSNG
jgi:hypothetical protein